MLWTMSDAQCHQLATVALGWQHIWHDKKVAKTAIYGLWKKSYRGSTLILGRLEPPYKIMYGVRWKYPPFQQKSWHSRALQYVIVTPMVYEALYSMKKKITICSGVLSRTTNVKDELSSTYRVWYQCFSQAHLGGEFPPPNFEFPPKNLRRGLLLCECKYL